MKNNFTFPFLFIFLFSLTAYSQQENGSFGIFSGISLNTNSYDFEFGNSYLDTSYTNDIKTAFNIGAFVLYDFVKNFGLKFQGQYTNKGGTTKVPGYFGTNLTAITRTYKNTIHYLQFSLLPQLNLPFDSKAVSNKVYFNAGGYLSAKLSATETIDNQTFLQQLIIERDISNSLTGTDAGVIFSAGVVYSSFMLDIRYDLGLTNIVDDPNLKDILNIKNRSINFSIGWRRGF
ncbi:MAG: PorT family protein [Bacteroidota bacterium]|nr:PorT family protein [Bacteroidota bacterium]